MGRRARPAARRGARRPQLRHRRTPPDQPVRHRAGAAARRPRDVRRRAGATDAAAAVVGGPVRHPLPRLGRGRFGQQDLFDYDDLPGRGDAGIDDDADLKDADRDLRGRPVRDRMPHPVEAPFALVLAGQVVRGRIDAVYAEPDGDGYLLVDWKTNRRATADPLQLGDLPAGLGRAARRTPVSRCAPRSTTCAPASSSSRERPAGRSSITLRLGSLSSPRGWSWLSVVPPFRRQSASSPPRPARVGVRWSLRRGGRSPTQRTRDGRVTAPCPAPTWMLTARPERQAQADRGGATAGRDLDHVAEGLLALGRRRLLAGDDVVGDRADRQRPPAVLGGQGVERAGLHLDREHAVPHHPRDQLRAGGVEGVAGEDQPDVHVGDVAASAASTAPRSSPKSATGA